MDVNFSNAYTEILLENVESIVKQSFIVQAKLRVAEKMVSELSERQKHFDELLSENNALKQREVENMQNRIKAEQAAPLHQEKERLQIALNETMQKNTALEKQIDVFRKSFAELESSKNQEIESLKTYVQSLEAVVPVTKLKKLKTQEKPEQKEDGSTF